MEIGLGSLQADIYLTCLKQGPQTAASLGRSLKKPRTTVYGYVKKMIESGFLYTIKRSIGDAFAATDPKEIVSILGRKELEMKYKIKTMEDNLENFYSYIDTKDQYAKINYYEGTDVLPMLYEKIGSSSSFLAYANIESLDGALPEYTNKVGEIVKNNSIQARELVFDNDIGKIYEKKRKSELHEIKLITPPFLISADNIILDDRVIHISYQQKITALEIINQEIMNSQKLIFDLAWSEINFQHKSQKSV